MIVASTICKIIISFSISLIAFSNVIGQEILDETEEKPKKDFKFIFQFDGRRSFVLGQPTPFTGLKIGLEYKEVHDFGLGFYGTKNEVRAKLKNTPNEILAQLNYNTLFYQYVFYHDEKWEFNLPLNFGGGNTTIREVYSGTDSTVINQFGEEKILPEINYNVAEFGVGAQYKIFKWFGIGSGIGYRFTFSSEERVKRLINAPTYSFKFKVFLGGLYRGIKDHYAKKRDQK